MSNPLGQAAKFAYDPKVLLAFIESKTTTKPLAHTIETKNREPYVIVAQSKFINGKPFNRPAHARVLRRWRNGHTTGVTKRVAEDILKAYGLTGAQLVKWAKAEGLQAIAWDNR